MGEGLRRGKAGRLRQTHPPPQLSNYISNEVDVKCRYTNNLETTDAPAKRDCHDKEKRWREILRHIAHR